MGLFFLQELESEVRNYGLCIGRHEKALKLLNDQKMEVEEVLSKLQGFGLWNFFCWLKDTNITDIQTDEI